MDNYILGEIRAHQKICQKLLYNNPKHIQEITNSLNKKFEEKFGEQIKDKFSHFYIDKKRQSFAAKTSGTTNGNSFHYLIDAEFYKFVEFDRHYLPVINQFNIKCKNILFLLHTNLSAFKIKKDNFVHINKQRSISSHGTLNTSTHYLNWKPETNETIEHAIKYMQNNQIDVILTDGSIINIIAEYVKKHNVKNKFCSVLSNTNEKLQSEDAIFLKKNGNIDDWCDHMRCWDGGASFMTCEHYTYHILEELSFVKSIDKKLISTDFFNLVQPFVNYWNGDFCDINPEYQLCKCGKWFREFTIYPREFSVMGLTSQNIKEKIKSLKINGIQQIRCNNNKIEIIGNISKDNHDKIQEILPKFLVTSSANQNQYIH